MSFYEVLTAAVNDLAERGYQSPAQVAEWARKLEEAARASMISEAQLKLEIDGYLRRLYDRMINQGRILERHKLPPRFTLDMVRPELRAALDRAIYANADLIRMNRDRAIDQTLQRFAGWATSIPAGGSDAVMRRETKGEIKKALASLPFAERRVAIDQGHKFTASLSRIIGEGSGAIAAIWHSHWRRPGYNYREDHKERDLRVFMIRGNWAQAAGLVKVGPSGYIDDITRAAEEVNCTCVEQYVYNLRDLPADMLTVKGREEMARIQAALRAVA